MITLNWVNTPEKIAAKLNGTREGVVDALFTQTQISMGNLREYIVNTKLSGFPLHHRTGNLIRSTQPSASRSQAQIEGKVTVANTAPYGRYQEYGAHIPERVPIRKKALHWVTGGADVFAMRARAFDLPPRSFMRSSLAEQRETIVTALATALNRAVTK